MLWLDVTVSSFLLIIVVVILPLIWWFVTARKTTNFWEWLGLKKINITNKGKFYSFFALTLGLFFVVTTFILFVAKDIESATSVFAGLGMTALIPAIIYAFIQTAFTEELFFRGFLLKRFASSWGFSIGNIAQSVLFGILHGVMFSFAGLPIAFVLIFFTGGIAWLMGYMNEKLAGGSIWLGWSIHGLTNFYAAVVAMFHLF